ncbi:MAG: phosphoribosylformylglycinamidine synthase II [Verrucomicrobia bacterium]|nr:MAG: phosphoribosylformylglycinamidine synthase II [Verrucomicrobiota bacterium]
MTSQTPTAEPAVTPELIKQHGLTPEEFENIKRILGREPNFTELGIFSVMWSEHCSYKNSKKELKKFPTTGAGILVKAGEENAGVVDIGDGWAIAFKMESHNHPSAIEPFQGAATGVGGIIRDIFTMGARPEFCLNSLRFGPITPNSKSEISNSKMAANRRLFTGVVSGIAHYGNCIGIPTIGGEIYFDESFEGNPLVNVFCLGVLRHEQLARGTASGVGNPVFYVGAETGRDGLAGAAFASRELTDQSREDRPAVQVGDPFKEKLLLEACLELEPGMTPYEILMSESQERMLIIARRGKEDVVRAIFEKWDVPCVEIGRVADDGMMRVRDNGAIAAEIPARALADEAPLYSREANPLAAVRDRQIDNLPKVNNHEALRQLLCDPTIASKNWVYRQYDHTVRTGTLVKPGSDAAVFLVRYANKILAATTDCNSLYCALDPREGGKIAVAEAARNLTCSGAGPLAITDNLNFGNPYKPENFWQLREAVEGIAEACRAFGTPVTGGNVSLYNESPAGVVDPTPTIGMVGLIDKEEHITTQCFKNDGDTIILVGEIADTVAAGADRGGAKTGHNGEAKVNAVGYSLGGSRYLKVCHGLKLGPPPRVDLACEIKIQNAVRDLIRQGLVRGAHDCSEGGLAVALAECCFNPEKLFGAEIDLKTSGTPAAIALFNESQSRIVISVAPESLKKTMSILQEQQIPFQPLGKVGGNELRIRLGSEEFSWSVGDLYDDWWNTIRRAVESDSAAEGIPSL